MELKMYMEYVPRLVLWKSIDSAALPRSIGSENLDLVLELQTYTRLTMSYSDVSRSGIKQPREKDLDKRGKRTK